LDQDLAEMKDPGSGGVTPSPAEGEIFLARVLAPGSAQALLISASCYEAHGSWDIATI
jgi:hypothetical protein